MRLLFFTILLVPLALFGTEATRAFQKLPYRSLNAIMEFCFQYRGTKEGEIAIQELAALVRCPPDQGKRLVRGKNYQECSHSQEWCLDVTSIAKWLKNRTLKGHRITRHEETLSLEEKEIDVSRTLLLFEYKNNLEKVRQKEALIDWLTLHIHSSLPANPRPAEIIQAINQTLFYEEKFHFPPYRLHQRAIDRYTSIGEILETRQGVCLGISLLYYSIAQRLGLPLELVTPPGHAYVRWRKNNSCINIETTARGIHLPSQDYLSFCCCSLKKRPVKEFLGLALINSGTLYFQKKEYQSAKHTFTLAKDYLEDSTIPEVLLALIEYLSEGKKDMLQGILEGFLTLNGPQRELCEDLLHKHVDAEGILLLFEPEVWTRAELKKRQKAMQSYLDHHPKFRQGLCELGSTHLALHQIHRAIDAFASLIELDANQPEILELLTRLYREVSDFENASKSYYQLESLLDPDHPLYWSVLHLKCSVVP